MAKIGLSDKQQAFVDEYCSNGHNASKAYHKAYPASSDKACESNGIRQIRKDKIKQAIAEFMSEIAIEAGRTAKDIDAMQQAAYNLAMRLNQPSAAVSAGTAIARLYGLDKDAGVKGIEQPAELTDEQVLELKAYAERATAIRLAAG